MSMNSYRRLAFSALLAGSLGLLASTVEAAPTARPARQAAGRSAFGSALGWAGSAGSAWSRLVHLFASDHDGAGRPPGDDGHSGGGPHTDEGPGMCPHGH